MKLRPLRQGVMSCNAMRPTPVKAEEALSKVRRATMADNEKKKPAPHHANDQAPATLQKIREVEAAKQRREALMEKNKSPKKS
jgi:hypothetical protein